MTQTITIVVPVFNEEQGIRGNLQTIMGQAGQVKDAGWELLVVDDGSRDSTPRIVAGLAADDPRVRLLALSRNFGKESAILAGLEQAGGDAVIVMDSDLQHPPELIRPMIDLWRGGAMVVEAVKQERGREPLLSRLSAWLFYGLFSRVSGIPLSNATDFKLLDRAVVKRYCALPERNRFFRGLIPWLGYASAQIPFRVPQRTAGASSWSFLRLLRLGEGAITSFSSLPLYLVVLLGGCVFAVSLVFSSIALFQKAIGVAVSGFTTVILLILFIGSVLMISLGVIGIYVARIYDETKERPPYVIDPRKSRP